MQSPFYAVESFVRSRNSSIIIMFWFAFLSAILALVLAQGEDDCTTLYKYDTVNTFRTEKSFNFSCYGVDADCEIYYALPGNGCNGDLLRLIDTVPENKTIALTFDEGFELGGRFCSNYQIGVYYVDKDTGHITAHLPRATEAGTKFISALFGTDGGPVYQCVVSALSLHANVSVTIYGRVYVFLIDPYDFHPLNTSYFSGFTPIKLEEASVQLDSDNPVIISCARFDSNRLATFQPMSPKPLVLNAGPLDRVYVIVSHCLLNSFSQNYSRVNFEHFNEVGSPCNVTSDIFGYRSTENCLFFVEPHEDYCVSMLLFGADDGVLVTMGMPESKFSTRFVNYPEIEDVNLISFSETTCTGFASTTNEQQALIPDWVTGDFLPNVWFGSWLYSFNDFSWMECENPVLLVSLEGNARIPFLSGYQSEDLWQPYFDSLCPNQPSSSSDVRSLVTSWVVFFAVSLFSSSLFV